MIRKSIALVLCAALALASSGCGSTKTAAPPAKAAVAARPPVPPCPESIVAGGDPLEAEGFEGKSVVRVCVVGGTEETRRAAQRAIELRPSDIFSAERVRADLEALLKLGTFDDAAAFGLRVQQGTSVVLLYSVHDRPRITDIAFQGAKVFGDAALNAKLPIAKDAPYDPAQVNVIAQAVRDEYRLRGYGAARIVQVAEAVPPDHVKVRLAVDEGALWRLAKIELKGNKKVSEAELRKAAGLEVGKPFVKEEVERASLLLSAVYYDRGFVQMRIEAESGAMTPQGLPLTFTIDEGDVHHIAALHVTKLGAPVEKEVLEKVVRARPKQVFVRTAIMQDIERVKTFFASRQQQVDVEPVTQVDPLKKTVELTFEIVAR
jgi:outer membrane protein insertion porin family